VPTSQPLDGGTARGALLAGGLLWLNPGHQSELIFTDRAPGVGLGLLLASFVVTFRSAAMGSAIVAQGRKQEDGGGSGGRDSRLAAQSVPRRTRPMWCVQRTPTPIWMRWMRPRAYNEKEMPTQSPSQRMRTFTLHCESAAR
jgi:hypothetical protein